MPNQLPLKPIETWKQDAFLLEEHTLKTEPVYQGVLINAWRDEVKLPDGTESAREFIKHPGASAVIPVFDNGDILLLGQYRYPLRKTFLEIPAGKLDKGEDPEVTAVRELEEEAGLRCKHLVKIGDYHPVIGYSDEIIHLYLGWGLTETEKSPDDDEFLNYYRLSYRKALELIDSNEITDSKTLVALLRGWRWWKKNGPFPL
jgi:ADP-ribose pyrophosphatase